MGEWNIQDEFFSRQKLGTPGTIARNVNRVITEKVVAGETLRPGQGVILQADASDVLIALAPTTRPTAQQVDAIVLLKANSLPDSNGDIIYASGEMIDVALNGFVYAPVPTGDGALIDAYTPAIPDWANNKFEWIIFDPSVLEKRIKPIQFIHGTDLDEQKLPDADSDTQIIYLPDRALDLAIDVNGDLV